MAQGKSLERERYWREVFERQGQSGLSAARFCREQGLALPSFYAWKQKLRQRDGMPSAGIPSADQPLSSASGLGRDWLPVRSWSSSAGGGAPMAAETGQKAVDPCAVA